MSNLNTNRVKKNHKELPISELLITIFRDHKFSTYVKFSGKLTFLTPLYEHVRVRKLGTLKLS